MYQVSERDHGQAGNVIASKGQWPPPAARSPVPARPRRKKIQVVWMYDPEGHLDIDHLVVSYAPLVKRIAYQLMARLPASVEVEDLIQNGMMGLLDAINRFEPGMAQFETYAVQRIRGAMLDGLRENDWVPRSLRRDMREIENAISQLEQQNGRTPTEVELAECMGVSLVDYQRMLDDARGHQLIYFEDFTHDGGDDYLDRHLGEVDDDPLSMLEDADTRAHLVKAIEALPEREKMVMALYYGEELNLREIGEVLNVTESRVSQMHSQAVARLRIQILGALPSSKPRPVGGARRGRPPKKPPTED
ncbi:RNA polymerase sigma factor FliA [Betaproteobacteria bacterium]|nr:RNA polymerase sigma factor FliA [Betaproteobacteria bacterium]GHT94335.1 RNA polymerase sigma factor FliA [Betaproteobacteria bacterium]GHU01380.1 RNA polymerase sigma factor FliA [Betaproteobacteria bacterium]GHU10340.1 RNA polymerase sigma factor FliA [Betaproteobacteria bacterium]GHU24249.1 RNA polymerase sigma factor FliA [Betaproteobacteria bacterium]